MTIAFLLYDKAGARGLTNNTITATTFCDMSWRGYALYENMICIIGSRTFTIIMTS